MKRILAAVFFFAWALISASQNLSGIWDVFDIAALLFFVCTIFTCFAAYD